VTTIERVVAPVDQRFELNDDDVSVTADPGQILVEPLAVTVGLDGMLVTVTSFGSEEAVQLPVPFLTV